MTIKTGNGIKIECSSFFNQGEWKPVDFETFKEMVNPADDTELAELVLAMEAGECILSTLGTLKFRKAGRGGERMSKYVLFDQYIETQRKAGKPVSSLGIWRAALEVARKIAHNVKIDYEDDITSTGYEAAAEIERQIKQCIKNGEIDD